MFNTESTQSLVLRYNISIILFKQYLEIMSKGPYIHSSFFFPKANYGWALNKNLQTRGSASACWNIQFITVTPVIPLQNKTLCTPVCKPVMKYCFIYLGSEQRGTFLPCSVGSSHVTELLWLSAVVCPNLLVNTVTVVSVTFTTLAAYGHGVGIVRDGVMRTARNQCCLIQHLFICAHVLGQSTFE